MTHHLTAGRGPRAAVHLLLLALLLLAAGAIVAGIPGAGVVTGVVLAAAVATHLGLLIFVVVCVWAARRFHRARAHRRPDAVGHVLHAPSFYDLLVTVLTLGRVGAFRERILDRAAVTTGERFLDVGCGTGALARAAARRVGAEGSVHGVDASPEMVARARREAGRARVTATFAVAPAQALPFPDGAFDVVTCTLVMHHLPSAGRADAVREMRRVLRPGGRVLVADLARGSGLATLSPIALVHGRDDRRVIDEVASILKDAGFDDIASGHAGLGVVGYASGTRH